MPVRGAAPPLTRPQQSRAGHRTRRSSRPVGEGELRSLSSAEGAPQLANHERDAARRGAAGRAHGNGIVVVTRAYTDVPRRVRRLGCSGRWDRPALLGRVGLLDERRPLARFRLALGGLYRLRTTEAGRVSSTVSTWRCRNEGVQSRCWRPGSRCPGVSGHRRTTVSGPIATPTPDLHDDDDPRRRAGLRETRRATRVTSGAADAGTTTTSTRIPTTRRSNRHARRGWRLLGPDVQDVARVDRHVARRPLLLASPAQRARPVRRSCLPRRQRAHQTTLSRRRPPV
jgi:hypothetical protein